MSNYLNGLDLSIIDGLKYYLYGSTDPDDNFSKRLRDKPRDKNEAGATITVDASEFMATGPGRYANPSLAAVVQHFFDDKITLSDGMYSLTQILNILELPEEAARFKMTQYTLDIISSDYDQRAFLWGTEKFSITDASFVVVAGIRVINTITIAPDQDNFDFEGGAGTDFVNTVLEPIVDPYGIGRKVIVDFLGAGKTITDYTNSDFVSDQVTYDSFLYNEAAFLPKLAAFNGVPFLNMIKENPYTGYFEGGRDVVYGANDKDDVMTIVNDITEVGIQNKGHGFTLVSGGGADTLSGSQKDDRLVAGKGNDLLSGGLGRDILEGQEGDDILVGGSGLDGRTINMKADGNPPRFNGVQQ